VDLADGVAVRVTSLCLDAGGRLSQRLLCGTAVRGGLLLDLALAGRVESTDDSVVVDPTPTGFGPADRLLAAVAVEPERTLDGWLDERRIGLRDLAGANVLAGRWEPRPGWFGRRFVDLRREQTQHDRALRPHDPDVDWTPQDACVAAVAGSSDLLATDNGRPPRQLIAASGAVAWLCAAVVEHILVTAARHRSQAGALGAGAVGPF
jgi:hypothetical protein